MPLSLVPVMVLRETIRPCASNDTIAVPAMPVMMLLEMSPETCSIQMPLPPLLRISQSVDAHVAAAEAMDQARAAPAAGCCRRRA